MSLGRIVAFDPGGTTGVCVWWSDEPDRLMTFNFGPDKHHLELYNWLCAFQPNIIVYESWQHRQQTGAVYIGIQYIGILELYAEQFGIRTRDHTAAVGKAFWKDDKLKALGLYKGKSKHERDAVRHMLYFQTFEHLRGQDAILVFQDPDHWVKKLRTDS